MGRDQHCQSAKELLTRLHPDAEKKCFYAFRYLRALLNWRLIEDLAKALAGAGILNWLVQGAMLPVFRLRRKSCSTGVNSQGTRGYVTKAQSHITLDVSVHLRAELPSG